MEYAVKLNSKKWVLVWFPEIFGIPQKWSLSSRSESGKKYYGDTIEEAIYEADKDFISYKSKKELIRECECSPTIETYYPDFPSYDRFRTNHISYEVKNLRDSIGRINQNAANSILKLSHRIDRLNDKIDYLTREI